WNAFPGLRLAQEQGRALIPTDEKSPPSALTAPVAGGAEGDTVGRWDGGGVCDHDRSRTPVLGPVSEKGSRRARPLGPLMLAIPRKAAEMNRQMVVVGLVFLSLVGASDGYADKANWPVFAHDEKGTSTEDAEAILKPQNVRRLEEKWRITQV